MSAVIEGLKRTRRTVEDPANWTQQASARLKNGKTCEHDHDEAVMWDVFGAVLKSSDIESTRTQQWPYLRQAFNLCPITYNDTNPHEAVLAGIDRAIALAIQDEAKAVMAAAKSKLKRPVTSEANKPQKFQEKDSE